jgi:hypothetical protein
VELFNSYFVETVGKVIEQSGEIYDMYKTGTVKLKNMLGNNILIFLKPVLEDELNQIWLSGNIRGGGEPN